jgi:CBS domain-containing protein
MQLRNENGLWVAVLNDRVARLFDRRDGGFRHVLTLVSTEETAVLRRESRESPSWRRSFLDAFARVLQRAAEAQAFDNLIMLAATVVLDGMQEVMHGTLKSKVSTGQIAADPPAAGTDLTHALGEFFGGTKDAALPLGWREEIIPSIQGRERDMQNTPVKQIMEEQLITISPEATLAEAAKKMRETNCGCLIVGEGVKPEGVITDRDIIVRAVAKDLDPSDEKVADHMTASLVSCRLTDSLADAAQQMREHGVSRLVVADEDGRACGVLSLGHVLRNHDNDEEIGAVIASVTGRRTAFTPKGAPETGTTAH